MIVNGFIEPLVKELPMEYAVEMNRLSNCRWKVRSAKAGAEEEVLWRSVQEYRH